MQCVVERDVVLPGSEVRWRFQVAQSREALDEQISRLRSTLSWSFAALGFGLLILAALAHLLTSPPASNMLSRATYLAEGIPTPSDLDPEIEVRDV